VHLRNCSGVAEAMAVAKAFAKWCTEEVICAPPMKLGYEKVAVMLLEGKKKRFEEYWEEDPMKSAWKAKGNACVRRNYCDFLKELLWEVVKRVFATRQPGEGLVIARAGLERLMRSDVEISKLALTTAATDKTMRETGAMAAVRGLAKRIVARNDEPIVIGDRFSMVYVDRKGPDAEKAETLDYAVAHNLKVDPKWYLGHLRGPFVDLFGALGEAEGARMAALFDHYETVLAHKARGQATLTSFFGGGGGERLMKPLKRKAGGGVTKK
jgi:DNA polymerase elongation subunit (family B)